MTPDLTPSEGIKHKEVSRNLKEKTLREQLRTAELELEMCKRIVAGRIAIARTVKGQPIETDLITDLAETDLVSGSALDQEKTKAWQTRLRAAFKKVSRLNYQLNALLNNRDGVDVGLN